MMRPERPGVEAPEPLPDNPMEVGQPLADRHRTGKSPAFQFSEKFWSRVNQTDSCWLWTGAVDKDGYGMFYDSGNTHRAHRFAFAAALGWLPVDGVIMHSCDTPSCVRPIHLCAGTHEDNVRDKIRKGRLRVPAGAEHWRRRLTMEQVTRAREMYASGGYTQAEVARHFSVSAPTIHRAIKQLTWEERNGR